MADDTMAARKVYEAIVLMDSDAIYEQLTSSGAAATAIASAVVDGAPLVISAVRLGCEDCVKALLHSATIDLRKALTRDEMFRVGGAPIYSSAGRNVLHVAVESHSSLVLETLLEAGCGDRAPLIPDDELLALLLQRDADTLTPIELAQIVNLPAMPQLQNALKRTSGGSGTPNEEEVKRLLSIAGPCDARQRDEYLLRMRQRVATVVALRETFKYDAAAAAATTIEPPPPFNEGFSWPSVGAAMSDIVNEEWRSTFKSIAPGVFTVELLTTDGCARLLAAVAEAERRAVAAGITLRRPNSMNNYGAVLDQLGFGAWLRSFAVGPMVDLAKLHDTTYCHDANVPKIFAFEDAENKSFRSVHAFTIKYAVGGDTHLATHLDQSDITFNVSLGVDGFTGSSLYFNIDDDEHGTPQVRFDHRVGTAVVHRGKIFHGAEQLTSGERINLVVWCTKAAGAYATK